MQHELLTNDLCHLRNTPSATIDYFCIAGWQLDVGGRPEWFYQGEGHTTRKPPGTEWGTISLAQLWKQRKREQTKTNNHLFIKPIYLKNSHCPCPFATESITSRTVPLGDSRQNYILAQAGSSFSTSYLSPIIAVRTRVKMLKKVMGYFDIKKWSLFCYGQWLNRLLLI